MHTAPRHVGTATTMPVGHWRYAGGTGPPAPSGHSRVAATPGAPAVQVACVICGYRTRHWPKPGQRSVRVACPRGCPQYELELEGYSG